MERVRLAGVSTFGLFAFGVAFGDSLSAVVARFMIASCSSESNDSRDPPRTTVALEPFRNSCLRTGVAIGFDAYPPPRSHQGLQHAVCGSKCLGPKPGGAGDDLGRCLNESNIYIYNNIVVSGHGSHKGWTILIIFPQPGRPLL